MAWSKKTSSLISGAVGLIFVTAGALAFLFITGRTMHKIVWIPLAIGAAQIAASAATSFEEFKARTTGRGAFFTSFSVIASLVVIAALTAVNYIVAKKGWQHDFTKNKVFTLADQTTAQLKGLKETVHVQAFFRMDEKEYQELDDLLGRYKTFAGDKLTYEFVDPIKDPIKRQTANITQGGPRILVKAGAKEARVKEPTEEAMTNALMEVTRGTQKKIYFVTGHGEKSIKDDKEYGYKKFVDGIKSEGFQIDELSLFAKKEIPADAQVLVVAGPVAGFTPEEVTSLKTWTEKNGRLFVMLDPGVSSGLEALVKDWGVEVKEGTVLDPQSQVPTYALAQTYAEHPITAPRRSPIALGSIFPLARPVHKMSSAPTGWTATELVKTGEAAWGKVGPMPSNGEQVSANPQTDDLGPVPLATVTTKGSGDNEVRVAVFGDSDFASNQVLHLMPGNYDIALNTIDWLAHEENKISIRPKQRESSHLFLTADQSMGMSFATLILLPLSLLGFGMVVWLSRRDK